MEKKCYQCKKTLDIVHFTDNDKVLSKCNICRSKIAKKSNKCEICGIGACYNYENQKNGIRCATHKEITMIDVTHIKCTVCKIKRPYFNKIGETKALFCSNCREPDMINIKKILCIKCKTTEPMFNKPGENKALYCAKCKESDMVDLKHKMCIICKKKRPNFNKEGETEPLFCFKCKEPDMTDISHAKCIRCKKVRPTFNLLGESKPLYCVNCKQPEMIDIKGLNCVICNIKRPLYNEQGKSKPLYCINCKQPTMINVKSAKCINCKIKLPIFNYPGENKALFCLACKTPEMTDIVNKKCIKCNIKQPVYNKEGEKISLYCLNCKDSDMINIKDRICKIIGCRKVAYYALPGVIPEYCSTHRLDGMIKNPRKKCIIPNCNEIATHGLIQSEHCENHALSDEYNFAERTCPKCGKIDILNKEGICVNTCSLLDIDNAIKKRKKKHEEYVGKVINTSIDTSQILFTWNDQVIDTSCTKQRPDFVFHCGSHVIIVEVDEEQHKSYKSCGNTKDEVFKTEARRMYNVGNIFVGLPVTFLRFNPDNFKDTDGKKVTIATSKRHDILIKWLKKCIKNDFAWSSNGQPKLRVKYLFYDGYEESDGSFMEITEKHLL